MRKQILWTMFALLWLLPVCGLAVTEGVVEAAPQVEVEVMQAAQLPSYLPDESYYADYGGWTPEWENAGQWVESVFDGECYYDVEQRPRMTAGEAARAKALLEKYQKGEIAYTGESVLNKMEDVIVGVYALDPDDYDGETAFVLLPGPCMTDEQILAVIDAFAQLGLTFDPDSLNYRNCARGGGIETSRFFAEEERERYVRLARLIENGMIDVSAWDASAVVQPKLDSRYFCGMTDFTLRPYHAITDEELVALLVQVGTKDLRDTLNVSDVERRARKTLCEIGAPLSMTLEYVFDEGGYTPCVFDPQGKQGYDWNVQSRRSCGAMFSWTLPEGNKAYAQVMYDFETGEMVSAHWAHQKNWDLNPGPSVMTITGEEALSAAKDAEAMLGLDSPVWYLQDEAMHNDWGACRMVRTPLEDGSWLTVFIGGDDGRLHGVSVERGETVETLPRERAVNG